MADPKKDRAIIANPEALVTHAARVATGTVNGSAPEPGIDDPDDGCGIGGRGIADFIIVSDTIQKMDFVLDYNSIIRDWARPTGALFIRFSFPGLMHNDLCWLTITGSEEEPTYLKHIVLAMQSHTRKTLQAGRCPLTGKKRIADIRIELAPASYDPFEKERKVKGEK